MEVSHLDFNCSAGTSQLYQPTALPRPSPVIGASLPWQVAGQNTSFVYTPISSGDSSAPAEAFVALGTLLLHKIDPAKVTLEDCLGEGAFGAVYRATWEGAPVAVKRLKVTSQSSVSFQEFEREAKQMAELNHPRVVCFYGISTENNETRMVMEFCSGGTLRARLNKGPISWPERLIFARDIASGLDYLHRYDIFHVDLAADNVLLDDEGRAKLADFGLAVKRIHGKIDMTGHSYRIRAAWNAPEVFQRGEDALGSATDIYCYGVVLWELATGKTPGAEYKLKRLALLPGDTPAHFRDLIIATWRDNPSQRPTAARAFSALATTASQTSSQSRSVEQLCALLRQNSSDAARSWRGRFQADLPYLPPQASRTLDLSDRFSALGAIAGFLDGKSKVLLILGDSGMGKSSLLTELINFERTPILASLPSCPHPEQDLMQTVLQRQGLSSGEIASLRQIPLLLLLDGYDEIATDDNLYRTNRLDQWDVKVIITCRTERIARMQGNYKSRFEPHDPSEFEQLVLAPFDRAQIEAFIKGYANRDGLEGEWKQPNTYYKRLEAISGMDDLISNPFFLFLVLSVLPNLSAEKKRVTRKDVYTAFLKNWFSRQQERLGVQQSTAKFAQYAQGLATAMFLHRRLVVQYRPGVTLFGTSDEEAKEASLWAPYFDNRYHPHIARLRVFLFLVLSVLPDLSAEKKRVTCKDVYTAFLKNWFSRQQERLGVRQSTAKSAPYAQGLAAAMFLRRRLVVQYRPGVTLFGSSDEEAKEASLWAPYFDNRYHPHIARLRAACPLQAAGDQWRFLHKSIWEYFVSRAILSELRKGLIALLNSRLLNDEPGIIDFLADSVRKSGKLQRGLLEVVIFSREHEKAATAAANSMTILVRAGISFSGMDLHGVRIGGSILSGGVFDGTNFEGADLSGAEAKDVCFSNANLSRAILTDVNFGQQPYLKVSESVSSVCYSADGRWLAAAAGKCAYVWDAASSKPITTLTMQEHEASPSSWIGEQMTRALYGAKKKNVYGPSIRRVTFSPDGRSLAMALYDSTLRVWDWQANREIHVLRGHNDVQCVAFSPSGLYLASGGEDLRVWDTKTGQLLCKMRHYHARGYGGIAFSLSEKYLASASRDYSDELLTGGSIRLWEVGSRTGPSRFVWGEVYGVEIGVFSERWPGADWVIFSPNGRHVVGTSYGGVAVWEAASGRQVAAIEDIRCNQIAFSANGQHLAIRGEDGIVQIRAFPSFRAIASVGHAFKIECFAFRPDGEILAGGSADGTVRLWEFPLKAHNLLRSVKPEEKSGIAISSDGRLVAAIINRAYIRIWDCTTGESVSRCHKDDWAFVHDLVFSKDGRYLAGVVNDSAVIWDVGSGEQRLIFEPARAQEISPHLKSVAFHPSGKVLAACGYESGKKSERSVGKIWLWDLFAQQQLRLFVAEWSEIRGLAFSPDGTYFASLGSSTVQIHKWESGETVATWKMETVLARAVFSPDGGSLMLQCHDMLRIISIADGRVKEMQASALAASFSSDGKNVSIIEKNGTMRVLEVATGREVLRCTLDGHVDAAFGPDGKVVVCTSTSIRYYEMHASHTQRRLVRIFGFPALTARGAQLTGTEGLSAANLRLLEQHGAIHG
jgi:WD40 repeat protein/serine/threonine protein kinase